MAYADLNNYSIVLRIQYGQTAFLFTGDAEELSENEQLAKDFIFAADVLKVGHHGSLSSTTPAYLDAISPGYAVISCGKDNSYGHPHSETVSKLAERGVTLYRTDENGTVTFSTDGKTITANIERVAGADNENSETSENKQESSVSYITNSTDEKTITENTEHVAGTDNGNTETSENKQKSAVSYIGNKNSKKFHLPTCGSLPAEKNRVYFASRDEAINGSFQPCKNCKP